MAKYNMTNATILLGGVDLSGQTNNVDINASVAAETSTTFASQGWEEVVGGIAKFKATLKGFWNADTVIGPGEPDLGVFNNLGGLILLSCSITNPQSDGDQCYFGQPLDMSYQVTNQVGKLAGYNVEFAGDLQLVHGQVLDASTQTASGTDASPLTLPAVLTGHTIFCGLHVLSVAGTTPSLTMTVQSDATGDAWASPTTRFTFNAFNAYGWQFMSLAGPITDTGWRTHWTISGTTQSFTYAVVIGIF